MRRSLVNMRFGLEDSHWQILEDKLFNPLRSYGAQIWVFGSRARGDHKPFSDIDILFALPDGTQTPDGMIFLIKEELAESNLPIKVDLVNLQDLAFSYRESVLKDRVGV